jgi:hypothetical protein
MTKSISINGNLVAVLNALSSGPSCPVHTYEIAGGYVYEVAGQWKLQRRGQWPVPVKVVA